jgi:hypothetical protein
MLSGSWTDGRTDERERRETGSFNIKSPLRKKKKIIIIKKNNLLKKKCLCGEIAAAVSEPSRSIDRLCAVLYIYAGVQLC